LPVGFPCTYPQWRSGDGDGWPCTYPGWRMVRGGELPWPLHIHSEELGTRRWNPLALAQTTGGEAQMEMNGLARTPGGGWYLAVDSFGPCTTHRVEDGTCWWIPWPLHVHQVVHGTRRRIPLALSHTPCGGWKVVIEALAHTPGGGLNVAVGSFGPCTYTRRRVRDRGGGEERRGDFAVLSYHQVDPGGRGEILARRRL